MIMHWQQWYFVGVFVVNLLAAGAKGDKPEGVITAIAALFGVYVLYSAGFFTGSV